MDFRLSPVGRIAVNLPCNLIFHRRAAKGKSILCAGSFLDTAIKRNEM
jgi:hypothetical protein